MSSVTKIEINKKDISVEWPEIVKGLALVPSKVFGLFKLSTESLSSNQIEELVDAVKKLKQKMHVEVQCEKATLKLAYDNITH